ncbi:TatD family hydrolase [Acetivibrio ethanolgignens]|uniref:Hydrolase TatD n=1 Tax=Acetivibrio ethanolgignens TaxID=290052 RepID=A0A0V8QG69_9FIRM|nr:TatD family hydrolase [Acetivibrio ethanolgignens]KSV59422.1 hydrolase TatD [Acetivibrio ethanolgignens]
MEARIFETHAHYEDRQFDEDREELLKSLPLNGIEFVVNVSSSLETVKRTLELTKGYDFIYGAVGVHPEEALELTEESFAWLSEQLSCDKIVAVGEIGLDYYWKEPDPAVQKIWFERQIALAREKQLPMIIHSRDAAKDTYELMKAGHAEEAGGVIHCFSYAKEIAEKFLDMGFYLGIGGVVTFKNSKKLKEVVEYAPLERILLETDCPYMAPVPNRGKRNSSLNLIYVAEEIGRLKGCSTDEVIAQTTKNARKMYRI